eukprot:3555060-Prymnesium_polylepis.1
MPLGPHTYTSTSDGSHAADATAPPTAGGPSAACAQRSQSMAAAISSLPARALGVSPRAASRVVSSSSRKRVGNSAASVSSSDANSSSSIETAL